MNHESAVALTSLALTYFIRSSVAALFLWLICKFISSPDVRFRLWRMFSAGLAFTWVWMFIPARSAVTAPPNASHVAAFPLPQFSWQVSPAISAALASGVSLAPAAYEIGVASFLLLFCARWLQLRGIVQSSLPAPLDVECFFQSVCAEIRVPRSELRLVSGLSSPAAAGWWRPKILLPVHLLPRLNKSQLRDIFRHELIHVQRRDYLSDRLSTLACYLLFFHPAIWAARRSMRWDRELVCDEGVAGGSQVYRLEYADCLAKLARWRLLNERASASVDILSPSESLLTARVRMLLDSSVVPYSALTRAAVATAAAFGAVTGAWLAPAISLGSLSRQPQLLNPVMFEKFSPMAKSNRRQKQRYRKPAHAQPAQPAPELARVISSDDIGMMRDSGATAAPVPVGPDSSRTGPELWNGSRMDEEAGFNLPRRIEASSDSQESQPHGGGSVWGEGPAQPPRTLASTIGSLAARAIGLGISIGEHRGDHDRDDR
jgi:beta-lactamase regulating signal transducer with metallopeptidase domain